MLAYIKDIGERSSMDFQGRIFERLASASCAEARQVPKACFLKTA
jgi:hypothetical protein